MRLRDGWLLFLDIGDSFSTVFIDLGMKIIECPRDAMQGLKEFIPTQKKIDYINSLLDVGFDTIDFGSFVSEKAVPQMRDTRSVVEALDLDGKKTKLLAIIANLRGAEIALEFDQISYLGYPLSLSETFQQRNTNRSISEAFDSIKRILEICEKSKQELVVYLSMGFGNPYGDDYSPQLVVDFAGKLVKEGVKTISLADTIGTSKPEQIIYLFRVLTSTFEGVELGVHLHSNPSDSKRKIEAAIQAGCHRFDGAILGFGGCPMAKDDLVGNIDTSVIINTIGWERTGLDQSSFNECISLARNVFY